MVATNRHRKADEFVPLSADIIAIAQALQDYRRGRLPGRFVASVDEAADTDENTALPQRCMVKIDNGWACHEGYRASCVRPADDWKGD